MAMGKRKICRQEPLFLAATDLPCTPAHPFYERLNQILAEHQFDPFVEGLCQPFYAEVFGRPSLEPGKYFRFLLLGYFEHRLACGRLVQLACLCRLCSVRG